MDKLHLKLLNPLNVFLKKKHAALKQLKYFHCADTLDFQKLIDSLNRISQSECVMADFMCKAD